jgi:hypothetical protein
MNNSFRTRIVTAPGCRHGCLRVAVRPTLGHAALPSPRAKRGETMQHDLRSEFEVFLVEDVILTLGNLRGSLSWLGTSQSADPAIFRAGLDRLDRQIGMLEDRARVLKRQMVVAAAGDAASGGTTTVPGGAAHPQEGIAHDDRTGATRDGTVGLPPGEPTDEASVDLEVGPDLSSGSKADSAHCPAQVSSFPEAGAEGDAVPESANPHPMIQPSADLAPLSLAFAQPAQLLSDDGDDLNIFGSDPDLSPDPSWSPSPVPFRSRRSRG